LRNSIQRRRSAGIAERKRQALGRLWNHDARVSPWRGTAWGVVQAVNTYVHHEQTVRGAARAERNMLRAVDGGIDQLDTATLRRILQLDQADAYVDRQRSRLAADQSAAACEISGTCGTGVPGMGAEARRQMQQVVRSEQALRLAEAQAAQLHAQSTSQALRLLDEKTAAQAAIEKDIALSWFATPAPGRGGRTAPGRPAGWQAYGARHDASRGTAAQRRGGPAGRRPPALQRARDGRAAHAIEVKEVVKGPGRVARVQSRPAVPPLRSRPEQRVERRDACVSN
jgi:hypothetical protein